MFLFVVALAWTVTIAYLLFRAVVQFQAYKSIDADCDALDANLPAVSIIVPARNESNAIASCLHALAEQRYPPVLLEIIAIDDNSTDNTAEIVRDLAEANPLLRLIHGKPLLSDWAGKAYACWQGAGAARGEWLCFIDADTVAGPELVRTAVTFAESQGIDMLSLEPFQELVTFWERLVIPAGLFVVALVLPDFSVINAPDTPSATANGQFILIRRSVYESIGGHGHPSVRGEICEDRALATLVRRNGFRTSLFGGEHLIRVRMYTGFRELWHGLSRNALNMVEGPRTLAVAGAIALLLGWGSVALPVLAWATTGGNWDISFGTAGTLLVMLGALALLCTHIAEARHFRIPHWYGFLFPLGLTIAAAIAVNVLHIRSSGAMGWKGRVYAARNTPGGSDAELHEKWE